MEYEVCKQTSNFFIYRMWYLNEISSNLYETEILL